MSGSDASDLVHALERAQRRLRSLLGLRAAIAPFRAALEVEEDPAEGVRHLLALWRPCQDRLDRVLDVVGSDLPQAVRLRAVGWEIEGHLLDEAQDRAGLADAADALAQVCEALLPVSYTHLTLPTKA